MSENTYVKEYAGFQFHCRPDTLDEYVCNEVFKGSGYRKLDIGYHDVVLDLGGNIGAFAVYAGGRAGAVHTFEPAEENLLLLKKNVEINKMKNVVQVYECAVVGNADEERSFFLNKKKNKGTHSLYVKGGRDEVRVSCINVNDVFQSIRPNKVKMDIEGAEYENIQALEPESWESVEQIVIEFHHAILKDKDQAKFKETIEKLKQQFKHIVHKTEVGKNWTSMIFAEKTSL